MGDNAIFRAWVRDRVDYDALVRTLDAHAALAPMKRMIGSGGIVMLLITMLAAISPTGQTGPVGLTQAVVAGTVAGLWALRWWVFPWPSKGESLLWVALIDLLITANNIMVSDRLLGALGIVLLVTTGAYVAIFHGTRLLGLHLAWSLLSIVVVTLMMMFGHGHGSGDIPLGAGTFMANVVVLIVTLPVVQFVNWLIRLDALADPLTGLLNRRGLDARMQRFFEPNGRGDVYVVTIDLDRFKSINDTFGHATGDEVLIRTAACLRTAAPPGAVVARTGGEEFAVVGRRCGRGVAAVAEGLRHAIEVMTGLPVAVTASVGAAVSGWGAHSREELFRQADSAMYRAKGLGGNTVVVAPGMAKAPPPQAATGPS
ncbi:GGDEF domain-containing protein [Nocardia sp. CDC159]|uniref:GGDEF domain-containing protein n=1 Tax=Nocardia pulmonis TaxID=2951408 RepID=A0A9X2IYU8_9NOCA|nr:MULTISPECIES: GGDEF domain-containing protein [Nocardia]MCM6777427.1 GGDEF domain-containing protein [Nocardia pulmonis]MCM6790466.1 GGDEF domain-containing protein [Nocardia sp. CDC159]